MRLGRRASLLVVLTLLVSAGSAAIAGGSTASTDQHDDHPVFRETFLPGTDTLTPYRGDLHAHTAYSDGEDTPEIAYQQAQAEDWLDFFAVTDHSDYFLFPFRASFECAGPSAPGCYESPAPQRTEWEETGHHAQRLSDEDFLAMRGFEWSSFVEGHVNVYDTRIWTDAEQTGQAPMTGLYGWMAGQQLDEDRWATFNHPGREPLRFDDFRYEPRMDRYFVGLEAFNRDDDYSDHYTDALDEGWHLGAHGVTDGHGAQARLDRAAGHTVALLHEFTKPGLREAFVHHHTVATRGSDLDARLHVDGALMGDVVTDPGETVDVELTLYDAGQVGPTSFEAVELLGPDGYQQSLAIGDGQPCQTHTEDGAEWVECDATVDLAEMGTTDLGEKYVTARGYQDYEQDSSASPTVVPSAVWIDGARETDDLPQP